MQEKPLTAAAYSNIRTEHVERVLLEVWARLSDFHDYLVLVGGLAPRYIVPQDSDVIPRYCGTLDIDLAVSLAVSDVKAYSGIRETLERAGLDPGTNRRGREQRHSFVMKDTDGPVVIDFLTTRYEGPPEVVRAVEGQLSAIQVEGLGLALRDPLFVPLAGRALRGGLLKTKLRVCRPVPFVILKALAFAKRREGKDVHDMTYVLRYAGGPARLARSVRIEERESEAFLHALAVLKEDFASPEHDGPARYAQFLPEDSDARVQAYAAAQEFLHTIDA